MEWYFYLDNPYLVFLRVDKLILRFNKLKIREMVSLTHKAGWQVGLNGKRSKKYAQNLPIIIEEKINQIKKNPLKPKDKKYNYLLCKYVYENFCQNCPQTECDRRAK